MTAFFDQYHHLWIELTDGKVDPVLMVNKPELFMVEHGGEKRVMINLTAYIHMITRSE